MDAGLVVALLVGLLLGATVGGFVMRALTAARTTAELAEARQGLAESHADRAEAVADLSAALAAAQAKLDAATERARDAQARAERLANDREVQANQFKVLSDSALEAQGRRADQLMTPIRDGLRELQARITSVEKDRAATSADLRAQVQSVQQTGEQLRRETHALVTALRKPQVRGHWGELQLKNAVELAGMRQHCDFDLQHTATTTAGTGIRPDMRVNLSDGKYVFVDSKVPLQSFLDAHDTDDEAQREAALDRFGAVVRSHVDQLSGKQYWAVDDHTPEFVIMFLPSEALAAEALSRMPDLHEYAIRRDIVIASPSTLIAMLRTIAHSWKQEALARNAKEVADLGRELHQRLSTMGGHFDKLGRSLQAAVKSYNQTLGSLETRVLVTARRMNELAVTGELLDPPVPVEESPRQVTAPELVDDAVRVTPMIGREALGRATSRVPEIAELRRADPDLFDLAGPEAPTSDARASDA